MRKNIYILLTLTVIISHSVKADKYPHNIEIALKKAGKNRIELEKAIKHYHSPNDHLKLKALFFLIANMDIHYSMSYYWADANGKKILFDELAYGDFNSAVKAFETIKLHVPKIHPVPYQYNDLDSIKSEYLIRNVDRAFEVWHRPNGSHISFANFCEYILPYRISVEPLEKWRDVYNEKFAQLYLLIKDQSITDALHTIVEQQKSWFTNTWNIESRNEPLPRLGALQLLLRKKGNCDDLADLQVFILRSQGYPVTIDNIPFWATTSGTHFFNVAFNAQFKPIPFDVATAGIKIDTFAREPSKVIRTTFSKQPDVVADLITKDNIPPGFMQTFNYKDVTREYGQTEDVVSNISIPNPSKKVAFVCVFNFLSWKPTWWGGVSGGHVIFKNMPINVVYLPAWYQEKKILPAGYPIALGSKHKLELIPDLNNKRNIILTRQEKYLEYQNGKKYRLYYWNNRWQFIGQQVSGLNCKQLVFSDVPRNALLLLLPEYSKKMERPFIVTDDNHRIWF